MMGNRLRGAERGNWKGGKTRTTDGYILIRLQPSDFFYPMTDKRGYAPEHRLVVAKRLGRNLHLWEIVHHKDQVKDHNDDKNLQLVSNDLHNAITHYENYVKQLKKENQQLRELVAELMNV